MRMDEGNRIVMVPEGSTTSLRCEADIRRAYCVVLCSTAYYFWYYLVFAFLWNLMSSVVASLLSPT